jgi:MFS family permease
MTTPASRRVFIAGMVLFSLASLFGGFATTQAWLLAARAAQGVGAAVIAPTALSLITITFPEGPPRNRAMGVYSAMSIGGAAVGLMAGIAYLPLVTGVMAMAGISAALVPRIGARPLLLAGSAAAAGGMVWLSRISEHSTYASGLLGPMLVTAAGLGMLFMPLTLVALSRVSDRDAGLASSLPNVGQQVGGSIGLAILGTVAWTVVANTARNSAVAAAADAKAGHPLAGTAAQVKTAIYDHALSVGFGRGFEVSAGIMLIALIITIAAVRSSAPTWPAPRLRRPARPGTTRAPRCSRPGNRPGRASRLMTWGSDGRVLIA